MVGFIKYYIVVFFFSSHIVFKIFIVCRLLHVFSFFFSALLSRTQKCGIPLILKAKTNKKQNDISELGFQWFCLSNVNIILPLN